MHDISHHRHRRPFWPRAGVLAAVAAIALLATACSGGGSTSSTPGVMSLSTLTDQALAYAKCMRSHGITSFPDPQEGTNQIGFSGTAMSGIDQSAPRFKNADKACRPLLPGGGP